MANKLIAAVALIAFLLLHGSTTVAETIPPEFKKAVTFIFLADSGGNLKLDAQGHPAAYGTGFFVSVQGEDGKGQYGYLVTAKHVLHDEKGGDLQRVFVRLNTKDGGFTFVPVDLYQGGKKFSYTSPDPTVDIAVIPAYPNDKLFDVNFVPDQMISTKQIFDTYNVSEGTDVFFVGLFAAYYGDHKNNPIIRFGRVSMFPDERIDWGNPPQKTEIYLIEAQSYGGNSGSPVFFYLGTDRSKNAGLVLGAPVIMLAGVMSGRFNDVNPSLGYIQGPTNLSPVTIPNIGIAAVAPAFLLHDILFSDELKKFRAEYPILTTPPPASEPHSPTPAGPNQPPSSETPGK